MGTDEHGESSSPNPLTLVSVKLFEHNTSPFVLWEDICLPNREVDSLFEEKNLTENRSTSKYGMRRKKNLLWV